MLAGLLALEHLAELHHKIIRIFRRPFRHLHIMNPIQTLRLPKVMSLQVNEHFRQVIKLWNQLPHIRNLIIRTLPRTHQRRKQPVWQVKPTTLQAFEVLSEWVHPHQEVKYHSRGTVVCAVVECWYWVEGVFGIVFFKQCLLSLFRSESSDGFGQIPHLWLLGHIQL